MPTYLSPGIYVEELYGSELRPANAWKMDCGETSPAEIAEMSTVAMIGFTSWVEINGASIAHTPTLVTSWRDYEEKFGQPVRIGYLADAVHGFFANGGRACIILSLGAVAHEDGREQFPKLTLRTFQDLLMGRVGLGAIRPGHAPGLLCFPDLMALYAQGEIDMKGVEEFQLLLINYCEYHRNCIAILDSPPQLDVDEVRQWREAVNYDSSRAVLYYPWLMDGDKSGWGTRAIPPCGHIAGVIVRTQIQYGIQKTPANENILDAADLNVHVVRGEQDMLNPLGINLLLATPANELRIWGARTLSSDPAYRLVKTRRVMMTAQRSAERALSWAIFETLNRKARERICCTLDGLLRQLWQAGALAGEREEEAYYLSESLEPANPSTYIVNVGLATDSPGVFMLFRLVFFTDDVIPDLIERKPGVPAYSAPVPEYSPHLVDQEQPPDIFISYSRRDWDDFVEPLVTHLRAQGLSVWVDQHLLQGGQDWMDEINHALKLCRLMILCISPEALDSRYVKMEYRYFFNANKPILPIICRAAELPAELSGIQFLPYEDQAAVTARSRALLAPWEL